jgi:uncharacterized membrane protein
VGKSITVNIPLLPANWRTTVAGLVGAVAIAVEPVLVAGVWDKERLIMAAAVGLVGYLAKDAGVSGTER